MLAVDERSSARHLAHASSLGWSLRGLMWGDPAVPGWKVAIRQACLVRGQHVASEDMAVSTGRLHQDLHRSPSTDLMSPKQTFALSPVSSRA